jgi:hypothetical protein
MNQRCLHCVAGLAFLLALMSFSSPGLASGDTSGYVIRLEVQQARVLVALSNAPSGDRPDCATNMVYAGVFSSSAAYAQQFYAALLTAQSRGTTVRVRGAGDCTASGTVEDILLIAVNDE